MVQNIMCLTASLILHRSTELLMDMILMVSNQLGERSQTSPTSTQAQRILLCFSISTVRETPRGIGNGPDRMVAFE